MIDACAAARDVRERRVSPVELVHEALAAIDAADVVLFLVSSDGLQEEVFQAMQVLRQQNKPMIFVLNVKQDLRRPVFMRRFLEDPSTVFGEDVLRGHQNRIRTLAGDHLGMREVRIVPIHADAAFLSTRPEHAAIAGRLEQLCRLGDLLATLEEEVPQ